MVAQKQQLFSAKPPTDDYAIIAKSILRNKSLTYSAKGLLVTCLAERHVFNREWIIANSADSPQSVSFALRQLYEAGYIKTITQGESSMYQFLDRPEQSESCEPPTPSESASESPLEPAKPRRSQPAQLELEPWLEPHRESLERWMALRLKAHPKLPREVSARSMTALKYARQLNVLNEFCELASESCWQSLGFSGYKNCVYNLTKEKTVDPAAKPVMSAINYTLQ